MMAIDTLKYCAQLLLPRFDFNPGFDIVLVYTVGTLVCLGILVFMGDPFSYLWLTQTIVSCNVLCNIIPL